MKRSLLILLAASATALSLPAQANVIGVHPGDTITAVFSAVQTAGYVLNNPNIGDTLATDNSSTAVYSGLGTNTLDWGTNTGNPAQGTNYSELSFQGGVIPANYGSSFSVGTLSFTNGTSALNTLIFGARIDFYDGSVFLGSDHVSISTTSNHYSGAGLTPAQLATDADFINICGKFSQICTRSIEAYENTESLTGASYAVNLTGYIDGLVITGVSSANSNGVIDTRPAAVPEPAALALLGLGLAGVAMRRRR